MPDKPVSQARWTQTALPPVLMLGDHFGYAGGVAHGGTVYFLNVLPALKQAGLDVTACFLREPHPAAMGLQDAGVESIFLSAGRMNPAVVYHVACIARERGCRIIHAAGLKATLVARIVGRLTGLKVIVHLHDLNRPGWMVGALHGLFARADDLGICVSRAARETAIAGYGLRPERLRVVYNGLALERLRYVAGMAGRTRRAELGIPAERKVILMVARMHPVKGHREMLHIMSGVVQVHPDALLLLAGDGPERAACETLVRQLGLVSHVQFLGQRNDVPELLAASDLVVVPSLQEGLSLSAIEALAVGKPVVAHAVGGLPEVVSDGVDGRLIALGDRVAFAQAIIDMFHHPETLTAYGERGMREAERFSLERHVVALLDCYHELAS